MLESVPSVEYKRLDETEKSHNDSLDDISVSLNNDPASRQGLGVASKDKERPEDEDQQQPLSFIDEDPSVIPEGQGNLSSQEAPPPSSGQIGETGNGTSGHVAVCDDCVTAGHTENGDTTAETPAVVVTADTVSNINQNIQVEKKPEEKSQNSVLETEEATEQVAESSAKTDIRPTPVTDTGNTGQHQDQDKRDDDDDPEEEEAGGLTSAQQPLMSSKLSVASIQSGESLGSFSFSADSLGKSWINDR